MPWRSRVACSSATLTATRWMLPNCLRARRSRRSIRRAPGRAARPGRVDLAAGLDGVDELGQAALGHVAGGAREGPQRLVHRLDEQPGEEQDEGDEERGAARREHEQLRAFASFAAAVRSTTERTAFTPLLVLACLARNDWKYA